MTVTSRKLKHAWESVACWLPDWAVGWYWRREVKHQFERMRRWADDPAHIERVKSLPAMGAICRRCGNLWVYSNKAKGPCEHQEVTA